MDETRKAAIADEALAEQLSALMDGELPEAEARFLQRRLANDPALRAKWSRLQVGASCLRNQPWQPVSPDLSTRIQSALSAEAAAPRGGRRVVGWAVAASLAVLAVAFAPRFATDPVAAPVAASAPAPAAATLASADLVAPHVALDASGASVSATTAATASGAAITPTLLAQQDRATMPVAESPLPDSMSPTDFPLVQTGDKHWPRSTLAGADDPAMEALLVRHNQMLANDGLGGFVPYVDVVATDPAAADGANVADAPSETPAQ